MKADQSGKYKFVSYDVNQGKTYELLDDVSSLKGLNITSSAVLFDEK